MGNRAWLAAGVFIHPGIQIGNDVFVNSRSVITKDIPSGKVVEGFPAKELFDINKIRRTVSPERKEHLIRQIVKHFASHLSSTKKNVHFETFTGDNFIIKWQNNKYTISIVRYNNDSNGSFKLKPPKKTIFLNLGRDVIEDNDAFLLYFNFETMKASYSKDKLFNELYLFMKRHYGLLFEYDLK
jgi:hypothetical protein